MFIPRAASTIRTSSCLWSSNPAICQRRPKTSCVAFDPLSRNYDNEAVDKTPWKMVLSVCSVRQLQMFAHFFFLAAAAALMAGSWAILFSCLFSALASLTSLSSLHCVQTIFFFTAGDFSWEQLQVGIFLRKVWWHSLHVSRLSTHIVGYKHEGCATSSDRTHIRLERLVDHDPRHILATDRPVRQSLSKRLLVSSNAKDREVLASALATCCRARGRIKAVAGCLRC
ncbi:hypothetical protein MRB53_037113 [Persea americana]|nr:hypothetical protein MRB53_037113 [Persea americana]